MNGLHDVVPETQQPLHLGPAKIEIAVLQPDPFRHLGIVLDDEGRRLGLIQNLHGVHEHLDVAGRQMRILGVLGTRHDLARDRDDTLAPQGVGRLMDIPVPFGIEHDLRDSRPVTKINEHDHAVVATAMHPPLQDHGLAHMRFV